MGLPRVCRRTRRGPQACGRRSSRLPPRTAALGNLATGRGTGAEGGGTGTRCMVLLRLSGCFRLLPLNLRRREGERGGEGRGGKTAAVVAQGERGRISPGECWLRCRSRRTGGSGSDALDPDISHMWSVYFTYVVNIFSHMWSESLIVIEIFRIYAQHRDISLYAQHQA